MTKRAPLLLACVALGGCGPSATQLVAHKHYREALCSQSDDAFVAKSLWRDTNAHLHVHVVTDEELATAVGDYPVRAIQDRARIVRLTLETNRLPVDGMRVSIKSEPAVITTPTWERLALLTHEQLPPMETRRTSLTGKNILNVGAILFSGGLWLLTDPRFEDGVIEVPASPEKYREKAPIASALREATAVSASSACGGASAKAHEEAPVGLDCTTYLVVDRVDARVDLVLEFEYVAYRWKPEQRDYVPREEDQCLMKHTIRVPLEGMPDRKPRRIADLAR